MPNDLHAKLQKLARLARCPSAARGEAVNAAAMLVKIAQKNHIGLAAYSDLLAIAAASESKPPGSTPPIPKPWNSRPPYTRPSDPPPVERPSVSREWYSKPPDYTPPYARPWFSTSPNTRPPRSKPKTFKPQALLSVMKSGRYSGQTFEEVYQFDPDYLNWVLKAYPSQKILRTSILAFLQTKEPSK